MAGKSTSAPSVLGYLKMVRDVHEVSDALNGFKAPSHWKCRGPYDLLLTHGRPFTFQPKPKNVKWGKERECFRNAFLLSQVRSDLTYVEGYAAGIIPVSHAWCVTQDGIVIDNTWRRENEPREYFGIPLKQVAAARIMVKSGVYGVVECWQERYPLCAMGSEEFVQPLPGGTNGC